MSDRDHYHTGADNLHFGRLIAALEREWMPRPVPTQPEALAAHLSEIKMWLRERGLDGVDLVFDQITHMISVVPQRSEYTRKNVREVLTELQRLHEGADERAPTQPAAGPWVAVETGERPELDEGCVECSISVLVQPRDEDITVGWYSHLLKCWYDSHDCSLDAVAWAPINPRGRQ